MIVYFANRAMDVLGLASTELPEGFHITDDAETGDVETGIFTFQCTVHWTQESRALAQKCTAVGNYMLKKVAEFETKLDVYRAECYTIIEVEEDTKDRTTYIYAESGGMDLLNSVVGPYKAVLPSPAAWYVWLFTQNSGFIVNYSEIDEMARTLEWTGTATVAERVASVGTEFDHAEIEYVVTMQGLKVWEKLINIRKKRGDDNHVILRLNQEVDRIVTTTSIADLATALYVEGGIPEGEEDPITLEGYSATADGGDIYTDGDGIVKSKSALKKWTRYANAQEPYQSGDGHIVKWWSYDTTSQSELFNRAVTQLQKIYTPAVNYEVDVTTVSDDINIGDYIYIVDEKGDLYLQSRVLQIQTSASNNTATLILGDYRLASDGLSTQVDSLTSQVASVRSQTIKTAAEVDSLETNVSNLSTQVSNLSSSTVKSSSSVSVTLSNSYGSASGSLSFSSGMSMNIQSLFSSYALLSQTAQIRLESSYGYAYGPFGFQSPLTLNIQNLLPSALSQLSNDCNYITRSDVSGFLTSSSSATITIKTSSASASGDFSFESGVVIDISELVGSGGSDGLFTMKDGLIYASGPIKLPAGTTLFADHILPSEGDLDVGSLDAETTVKGSSIDIYSNGTININTTASGAGINIGYSATCSEIHLGGYSTTIYIGGSEYESSDERLKTAIQPISDARVDNITPVTFKWKSGDDTPHYGYIAQEVREHIPEIVKENDDGLLSLAYTEIIPLLHCKINEQQATIESLEERILRLEALVNENT